MHSLSYSIARLFTLKKYSSLTVLHRNLYLNSNQVKRSHQQTLYYENRIKKLTALSNIQTQQNAQMNKDSSQKFQSLKSQIDSTSESKSVRYPSSFNPTISIRNFISKYSEYFSTECKQQKKGPLSNTQKVAGRVSSIRKHGRTIFIDIREQHVKLQLAMKVAKSPKLAATSTDDSNKQSDEFPFNRGDIIGVQGRPFITKKGQLSLEILTPESDLTILSPCLWMLPQYNTLKDSQVRYRKKYLDLMINPHSLQMVKTRAKIISLLRRYLEEDGYIQVQTPILSSSCGGAIAKPFTTYHNDHKMNLFMRIAPELYLKKLIIGGMMKIFEIGKNFRNQSIDQTHNPEFSTCELYCAYSDFQKMMKFTQELIKYIVQQVNGSTVLKVKHVQKGQVIEKQIDLSKEWIVYDFVPDLERIGNLKLPKDFESQQAQRDLVNLCKQHKVQCDQPQTTARLLDKLCGRYLQQSTLQPFFIINQPRILSPLAKPHPHNPAVVQRFQLFINGWELVNSYTQLNSPFIQKQNTPEEIDFVEALEYGLPPTAGWGMGLDRLVMLITGKERIQQVITFPLLKNLESEKQK